MSAVNSNVSRPMPRANTGSWFLNLVSDTTMFLLQMERRIDPWLRPIFDATLRDPVARIVTALMNKKRKDEGLKIAEEKLLPNEEEFLNSVIESFTTQMRGLWKPGGFERGGNTKTQGIVRGEFIVHDNLPPQFRYGIYAKPQTFRCWVRFSGPGPYITPDIDDVGFMSISIKLMGVPGPKLMDEEKFTVDMFGVSTPTFVTQDIKSNAHLQKWSVKNAQIFHFVNFEEPHIADMIMQGLWVKTQSSPFEAPYFSCVPYLLGEGQAMQYSVWPKTNKKTPIPRLPLRPPDDYLRNAMVKALNEGDVELDFRLQLQTDPFLMPIENNGVLWPEKLSPRVSVATLRLPKQKFDSPAQMEFARKLSYNPWHTIAEHRRVGEIPSGEGKGTAIMAPGTNVSDEIAWFVNVFTWKGKVFDPEKGELRNKILPMGHKAIVAKVYKDKSWFDQKECIVLDYSKTSLIAHWIRDEIREVSPGIYLGLVYWGKKKLIHFALQFPASG